MPSNDNGPSIRPASDRRDVETPRARAELEIRLFGVPRLLYRGEPLRFRAPQRALLLLAHLAVEEAEAPRKRIAFALWPDDDEDTALANMRRHLGLLEAALPQAKEPWIRKNRIDIAWAGGTRALIDVIAFRERAADPERYAEAVELYAGPFFDTSDDEWVVAQRERFLERQLAMLAALVYRYRQAEKIIEALGFAQQALRLDPFREDVLREVMWLRHASGDRIGALDAYRNFKERSQEELGAEPLPETIGAYETIASETLAPSLAESLRSGRAPRRDNLPAALTGFHGRTPELGSLGRLVLEQRLVTLWGPGGVGKTRLALRAALDFKSAFDGRVRFVDLATLEEEPQVGDTVLAAMGLYQVAGKSPLEALVEMLAERRVLIVLDNCEHLLDACAMLCDRLLRGCPNLHILATSREPLAMQGECVFPVEPFELPRVTEPVATRQVASLPAITLFLERAARDPAKLERDQVGEVLAICRQLDGLPLAIELAAAHAKTGPLDALLASLQSRFEHLVKGNRGALPRHRTLEAAIGWSVDQLSERDRELFVRLAVFRGHFTPEAALQVCAGEAISHDAAVAAIDPLVARSLVKELVTIDGRRYYLLESVRAFAQERFASEAARGVLLERHARAYEAIAREAADAFWKEQSSPWMRRIDAEIADFRAALAWFFAPGGDAVRGAHMLAGLRPFWLDSGRLREVVEWYERALSYGHEHLGHSLYLQLLHDSTVAAIRVGQVSIARATVTEGLGLCDAEDVIARGALTRLLGVIAGSEGDHVESERLMREALRLLEPAGNQRELAFALIMLARRLLDAGDSVYEAADAERTFLRALEIARHEGLVIIEARALDGLAAVAARGGDDERAHAFSTQSLAVFRRGDGRGRLFMAYALLRNAQLSIARSRTVAARDAILEAFSFFWFAGLTYEMVQALECYAELALREARPTAAALLLGSTAAFGGTDRSGGRELRERFTREAKAMMPLDDFEEAFAHGRGLPFEEAISEANSTPALHPEVRA